MARRRRDGEVNSSIAKDFSYVKPTQFFTADGRSVENSGRCPAKAAAPCVLRALFQRGRHLALVGGGTQVEIDEINKKYGDKTPVMVIDPTDYGMMDAEKVLKKAIVQMKKFKNK